MITGGKPDRVPFWFMRQAGRYLPEYRKSRAESNGFLDMVYSSEKACEITMQPMWRFGMDAAIIFSDILVIPQALGRNLEFIEGEGPKLNPLKTQHDIPSFEHSKDFSRFEETLSPIYEAISFTRETMNTHGFEEKTLIGFCGGPWTLALYMIEGGSSKDGFMKSRVFTYRYEKVFNRLIDILVEACAKHLIKQVEAGAQTVQIFDSWAGLADFHNFAKWVIEPTYQIVKKVREVYPNIPIIGFPRGAGINYIDYVRNTGVNGVSIDHCIDTSIAARTLQPLAFVQGSLDPACLLAGGEALTFSVQKIIADLKNNAGGFVFNLGHGIHKDTPIENVYKLVEIIKDQGSYR